MATLDQVASRLSQLLKEKQPKFFTTATTLRIQQGRNSRTIYLAPQEGSSRGVQSR